MKTLLRLFVVTLLAMTSAFAASPEAVQPLVAGNVSSDLSSRGQLIDYQDGDVHLQGFLAMPQAGALPRPGVLVVHEWWGLNDYARQRALDLAAAGYVAFAADIYGDGKHAETFEGAAALATPFKQDRALMRRRMQLALQTLRAQSACDPNRVAAIGYCFGGTCVLELARDGADVAGVVSFHGGLDTPKPAGPGEIRARVLVCRGAADPFVPAADVVALEKELTTAAEDWQMVAYGGAVHGFTNPKAGNDPSKGMAYNAAADHRSWQLMLDYFGEIFGEAE